MKIEITEAAREQIEKTVKGGDYMRIIYQQSGCCSFSLDLYRDIKRSGDQVIEADGVRFLAGADEMLVMERGITVDYGRKGPLSALKGFKVSVV